jgi:hypothetical protein
MAKLKYYNFCCPARCETVTDIHAGEAAGDR